MEFKEDVEFWRNIVDKMLTGVYITDVSMKYLYVNDIFSIATGYSKDELLKMSIFDLTYKEDLEKAKEAAKRALKGETFLEEFRYVTKTGKVRWVLGLYRPLIYKGHGYTVGNYIDITRTKELEKQLKESEEFYRMLIDKSLANIYIVQKGRFVFINKSFEDVTGYTIEEAMKMNPFDLVHPADREMVYQRYTQREAGMRLDETYSWRIIRKDGQIRWVTARPTRITFKGEPAVYATTIDTTDIHMLNEELRRKNEYFTLISKMFRHDIMNDLTVIRAAMETKDPILLEKALHRIEKIVEKIKDTKVLEDAIGALKIVNVAEIVKGAIEKYKYDARFNVQVEEIYVEANEALKSVIENIINNAIIHSQVSPVEIKIEVFKEGNDCVVRIADNGVGIPDEIKEEIFQPGFSRRGGGLGLFLVKKIVEMFRGGVRVYDNKPRGAVFEVRIPVI
ncbi:MAG: PAS domain S-box protein [Archaeoglobaceae archaeon]